MGCDIAVGERSVVIDRGLGLRLVGPCAPKFSVAPCVSDPMFLTTHVIAPVSPSSEPQKTGRDQLLYLCS